MVGRRLMSVSLVKTAGSGRPRVGDLWTAGRSDGLSTDDMADGVPRFHVHGLAGARV